ncbi:hypothetical protein MLD38_028258 [Melastoma candidum]|uniref:Uncharacterized protein n=1 Tax=Melastoma candidum TaxID=119954 RepID=A0ACB9N0K1_9MYRT|nr:hypothetical protein MLD38_028258 [Melastoma candidum]
MVAASGRRMFLSLVLLLAIRGASSQTDSCSSNLSVTGLNFNTTGLACIVAWSSQDYILRFKQENADLWSFILSAPDASAYIAMGFSPTGQMVGSSAVVGWVTSSGIGTIKQYKLDGTTPGQVKPDQGSLSIQNNTAFVGTQSSRIYIAFQLNTAQPLPNVIYSIGPSGFLPQSSDQLIEHADRTSTTIDYSSGQSTSQKAPYTGLRRNHGILNMLSWGILMIVGILVARHCKNWDPVWFYAHIAIQSCAFVLGVVGIICGFVLENKLSVSVSSHKSLGIVILVLGCLQVLAILARPEKGTKSRRYWNWYHHTVGRILIVLAAANVFYGIHVGREASSWKAGYGITLAALIVVAVILEIRLFRQN